MTIKQNLNHTFSSMSEPEVQIATNKLPQWVDEIKGGKVYWRVYDDHQMVAFLADLIRIDLQGILD